MSRRRCAAFGAILLFFLPCGPLFQISSSSPTPFGAADDNEGGVPGWRLTETFTDSTRFSDRFSHTGVELDEANGTIHPTDNSRPPSNQGKGIGKGSQSGCVGWMQTKNPIEIEEDTLQAWLIIDGNFPPSVGESSNSRLEIEITPDVGDMFQFTMEASGMKPLRIDTPVGEVRLKVKFCGQNPPEIKLFGVVGTPDGGVRLDALFGSHSSFSTFEGAQGDGLNWILSKKEESLELIPPMNNEQWISQVACAPPVDKNGDFTELDIQIEVIGFVNGKEVSNPLNCTGVLELGPESQIENLSINFDTSEMDAGAPLLSSIGWRLETSRPAAYELWTVDKFGDDGTEFSVWIEPTSVSPQPHHLDVEVLDDEGNALWSDTIPWESSVTNVEVSLGTESLPGDMILVSVSGMDEKNAEVYFDEVEHILIDEPPEPPISIQARDLPTDDTSINFTWNMPNTTTDFKEFLISWGLVGGDTESNFKIIPKNVRNTIINFESNDPHEVYIISIDSSGQQSRPEYLQTAAISLSNDVPPQMPRMSMIYAEGQAVEAFIAMWPEFGESDISRVSLQCGISEERLDDIWTQEGGSSGWQRISLNKFGISELVSEILVECVLEAEDYGGESNRTFSTLLLSPNLDQNPPPLVEGVEVLDAPDDLGDGLLVRFTSSEEPDVVSYEIHISSTPFSGQIPPSTFVVAANAAGVREILVEETDDGSPVVPDVVFYAVVLAIDAQGRVDRTAYNVGYGSSVDNRNDLTPPSPVQNVRLTNWPNDDGTRLLAEWNVSFADDFSHYAIYLYSHPIQLNASPTVTLSLRSQASWLATVADENGSSNISSKGVYYLMIIAIDTAGNGDFNSATVIGPIVPVSEVEEDVLRSGDATANLSSESSEAVVRVLGYDLSILDLTGLLLAMLVVFGGIFASSRRKGVFGNLQRDLDRIINHQDDLQFQRRSLRAYSRKIEELSARDKLTEGQFRLLDRRVWEAIEDVDQILSSDSSDPWANQESPQHGHGPGNIQQYPGESWDDYGGRW